MNIPPGFSQVNLKFTGTSVPRGAQLTFGVDNTADANTPAALAALVVTAYAGSLQAVANDTLGLTGVRVKNGPNDTGPESTIGASVYGAQSASAESPQVALLVNKVTSLGGRANRGRWFLPAVRESYVDGSGIVDAGGGAAIQTKLNAFLAALVTADIPMVILHNNEELTPTPVTGLSLQNLASSQRRRLRRVGGRRRVD